MAKLRVYKFPDQVLTQKASPIQRVEKSLYKLADDMLETMYCETGVGLAANQVGILQRILVIDADYDLVEPSEAPSPTEDDKSAPKIEVFEENWVIHKQPRIIINPEIIYKEGTSGIKEGCLSVPGFYAEVSRAAKIKLQYQDIDGLTQVMGAEGLLSIVIQHELDHLDGRLFIDRLSPLKKEMAKKRLRLQRAEQDSAEAEQLEGSFSAGKPGKKKKL